MSQSVTHLKGICYLPTSQTIMHTVAREICFKTKCDLAVPAFRTVPGTWEVLNNYLSNEWLLLPYLSLFNSPLNLFQLFLWSFLEAGPRQVSSLVCCNLLHSSSWYKLTFQFHKYYLGVSSVLCFVDIPFALNICSSSLFLFLCSLFCLVNAKLPLRS